MCNDFDSSEYAFVSGSIPCGFYDPLRQKAKMGNTRALAVRRGALHHERALISVAGNAV
jgi:hypothetical protein